MTNKPMLSVELRELLGKAASLLEIHSDRPSLETCVADDLRALLDEPDEPFSPQGWSIDHSAGRPILMHNKCSVIEAEQAYGLLNLIETAAQHQNSNPGWPDPLESTLAKEIINNPSAFDLAIRDLFDKLCREIQAGRYYRRFSGSEPMEFTANQGAPVAWVECSPAWLKAGGDCATAPRICVGREGISHLHPAHSSADQPAPVAVVMPDDWEDQLFAEMSRRFDLRKQIDDDHMVYDDTQIGVEFARDWVKARLSGVKP